MMRHLKLDMYKLAPSQHAEQAMQALGITYAHALPQSLYDSWWFFDCKNVPDQLPPILQHFEVSDPRQLIGNGLTAAEVARFFGDVK